MCLWSLLEIIIQTAHSLRVCEHYTQINNALRAKRKKGFLML